MKETSTTRVGPRWLPVLLSRLATLVVTSGAFVALLVWFSGEEPSSSRTRHLGIPLVLLAGGLVFALVKVVLDPIRVARGVPVPFESSGESSISSEDGLAAGIRYRYDPRMPRRLAGYCYATSTFLGAWVIVLVMFADFTAWFSYVLVAVMAVPAVIFAWRGAAVKERLTRDGGLAFEVTHQGIRLDGSDVLPWERIDLLVIDGRKGSHGKVAMLVENALFGVNHIRAAVFDDTAASPHIARSHFGAYERALPGGRDEFVQIARQLCGAASQHPHIRLRIAENGPSDLKNLIGDVMEYDAVDEAGIGARRGLDFAENQRRDRDRERGHGPAD